MRAQDALLPVVADQQFIAFPKGEARLQARSRDVEPTLVVVGGSYRRGQAAAPHDGRSPLELVDVPHRVELREKVRPAIQRHAGIGSVERGVEAVVPAEIVRARSPEAGIVDPVRPKGEVEPVVRVNLEAEGARQAVPLPRRVDLAPAAAAVVIAAPAARHAEVIIKPLHRAAGLRAALREFP